MRYRPYAPTPGAGSDWPAVAVALGILVLLGAVLVTATARWNMSDVRDIIGSLGPILGVVTGAFVTYFFTRQATISATSIARAATDEATRTRESAEAQLKAQAERLDAQTKRSRELQNALTVAFGTVDKRTADLLRQDSTIAGALDRSR